VATDSLMHGLKINANIRDQILFFNSSSKKCSHEAGDFIQGGQEENILRPAFVSQFPVWFRRWLQDNVKHLIATGTIEGRHHPQSMLLGNITDIRLLRGKFLFRQDVTTSNPHDNRPGWEYIFQGLDLIR